MTDKRAYDLDPQPTLSFGQSLVADISGNIELKKMSIETLLRTKVANTIDATGVATKEISFSNYNVALATIDQSCEFDIGGIFNNETVYLKVIKGAANIVSFYLVDLLNITQLGRTELYFEITKVNGVTFVKLLNNKINKNVISSNLTVTAGGSLTSFDYFNATTTNDICNYSASFTVTTGGVVAPIISLNIANWAITKYNESVAEPCSIVVGVDGVFADIKACLMTNEVIVIVPTTSIAANADCEIVINGTFRVK